MGTDGPQRAEGEAAQENLKLVRQHYTAFACGDLDGLLAGLDPQVTISVHDEHGKPASEPVNGLESARAFFEGIRSAVAHANVEIDSLRADENRVLAQVTLGGTVRKSGVTGAIPAVHLFTVHDGLITEIRTHRPDWRNYKPEGAG